MAVSMQHQERDNGYTQRLTTGSISENGTIQSNGYVADGQEVYYWAPGTTAVCEGKLTSRQPRQIPQGCPLHPQALRNEARIYKIESIAFSEESFVEISATYVPLKNNWMLALMG